MTSTVCWHLDCLPLSSPFFLRQARSKCPSLPQNLHVASLAGHSVREWMSPLHQIQDFFSPVFLLSGCNFGLKCLFLNPFLCDFLVGSCVYEALTWASPESSSFFIVASTASNLRMTSKQSLTDTSFPFAISLRLHWLFVQPCMSLSTMRN